jgi:hypothetical protein
MYPREKTNPNQSMSPTREMYVCIFRRIQEKGKRKKEKGNKGWGFST